MENHRGTSINNVDSSVGEGGNSQMTISNIHKPLLFKSDQKLGKNVKKIPKNLSTWFINELIVLIGINDCFVIFHYSYGFLCGIGCAMVRDTSSLMLGMVSHKKAIIFGHKHFRLKFQ